MSRYSGETNLQTGPVSEDEKIIILLGVTGSGKSSFIKAITNRSDIVVGHGLCSTTETVRSYPATIGSIRFLLVDTPGFNDTFRDDGEILKEITEWLASNYLQGKRITGVVYLHPINQPRMEGSALSNLTVMQKLCGSETFENVVLATTFWDLVDESSGTQRENELCQTPQFWGGMKRNGSRVVRIKEYARSTNVLLQLASKAEVALQIQVEMVEEKKELSATAAAQKLDQECIRLEREHQEQKKVIEDRAKAELKSREEENKRKLTERLALQKAALQIQQKLVKDKQRADLLLQQAKVGERDRLAKEAQRNAEKEKEKLEAIQERKEKLAWEQRQIEAAQKEKAAAEKRTQDLITKSVRASSCRIELKAQRHYFSEALSRWTVRAYTFTFEQQTPEFTSWCDRCFRLIRFGGYNQCYTCVLQICKLCWDKGDRCSDNAKEHRVLSYPERFRPSNCCARLKENAQSLICDRFGCGNIIRGLCFHCCHCSYGEFDICLKCVISGWTCPGNHKLHPTVNWPQ